jgi:hypothetical protein
MKLRLAVVAVLMAKRESVRMGAKKSLDNNSQKRRGPRRQIPPTTVLGRADSYRSTLQEIWDSIWPSLSVAQSAEDIIRALENAPPYGREFAPYSAAILGVLKEKRFPKRRKSRLNFIADSIAGIPNVSPRRSRDICFEERAKKDGTHRILRYEYYVECSCGYEGHSKNHACPNCGAEIRFPVNVGSFVS